PLWRWPRCSVRERLDIGATALTLAQTSRRVLQHGSTCRVTAGLAPPRTQPRQHHNGNGSSLPHGQNPLKHRPRRAGTQAEDDASPPPCSSSTVETARRTRRAVSFRSQVSVSSFTVGESPASQREDTYQKAPGDRESLGPSLPSP